jgi:hypothetical protein
MSWRIWAAAADCGGIKVISGQQSTRFELLVFTTLFGLEATSGKNGNTHFIAALLNSVEPRATVRGKSSGMAAMMTSTNRIGRGVAYALFGASVLASTSTFAIPRFDGLWSVAIVTEQGTCDRGYRYPIRISNGVLANAGAVAFNISGKVAATGAITVTVSHGSSSATGVGRLAGDTGAGNWHGGDCSGTWTAERRGS